MTYFADLGGMLDLLYLFFKVIVALFAEKLLRKALIDSMYTVQEYTDTRQSHTRENHDKNIILQSFITKNTGISKPQNTLIPESH